MNPVYVNGLVHVRRTQCTTCIFRRGNPMHLERGRRQQMERDAIAAESCIPCHQHIHEGADIEPICRGYWDRHRNEVFPLRMAQAFKIVVEVDPV